MNLLLKIQYIWITLLLNGSVSLLYAQADSLTDSMNQQLENLSETLENESADYTNLIGNLDYYINNPIDLNTATQEEIETLGLVSSIQIANLLSHIEHFGKLISIYELQEIDGFDLKTIYALLPYVHVSDQLNSGHFDYKEMLKQGKHEFILRTQQVLEPQLGYQPIDSATYAENPNARYLGSPQRIFVRYRFTYSRFISFGIIGEKDAGEEFFRETQKQGFDYYAGHLCIRNKGMIKSLIIGDYQVSFGQGLVAWTGFAFGKTSDALAIRRSGLGIRPYMSTDENRFFRGAAVSFQKGYFEATVFGSVKRRDANISSIDSAGQELMTSSLQTSGLHSIPREIENKDVLLEKIAGGHFSLKRKTFQLGIGGLINGYNINLQRNLSLYNQFAFSSQKNAIVGMDYDWTIFNLHFFGEIARSANGGIAICNGLIAGLDPRFAISINQRWLERNYQNNYGNAFAESSALNNEKGIYIGINSKISRKITLNTYIDRTRFAWLRYRLDAPSFGSDFLFQINYTPDKKKDCYFRYRRRNLFINSSEEDSPLDPIVPVFQDNFRFNFQYPLGKSFRLSSRVESVIYRQGKSKKENGFLIWQEITYRHVGSKLAVTGRYALFQTDSYDTRIYGYESDVLYAFSIPALYNKGSRVYLLINWNLNRYCEVWLRLAQTFYSNQQTISTGSLNAIQGNTKTEAKVQLRLKF
jgi:DNA uptake protein ComE-like DNA-binding protein